ncbi:hypothetical protein [Pseudonocardia dioxanivorans]|uniref:hypothetical protein n=1 Tax=Pseudonocardia dioxanivorans TaxID=240495 RepID=UPI000CD1C39B|nr:hypothetical protein [Pseudonocardia dioxanivorans]
MTESHRGRYEAGVKVRDERHDAVIAEAHARRDEVLAVTEALRAGRIEVADVRAGMRDVLADHRRLIAEHHSLAEADGRLEEFEAMTAEDHEAEMHQRFPHLRLVTEQNAGLGDLLTPNSRPTATAPYRTRTQMADDQDALVKALGSSRRN